MDVLKRINELADSEYKEFTAKIVPNINKDTIIGVRLPQLRIIAKELYKEDHSLFLNDLPHKYYEENLLHILVLNQYKKYDEVINHVEAFIPYIDNWAVNDTFAPAGFKKNKEDLIERIKIWVSSNKPYTIRFGLSTLMRFYLDDDFKKEYNNLAINVKSDEYYVKMMVAWYYATALAKQWNDTIYVIENNLLPIWTHNKTIQKAVESFRITEEQKKYLKTLKIKRL